jgi:two-component system, OmpR family, response regulator
MRVLIVEDNPVYGRLLADRLERAGFAVDLQDSVANSHDVLVKLAYAAIILDLGLPDADGLRLLQRLRAAGKTTPVIVVDCTRQPGRQGHRSQCRRRRLHGQALLLR